MNKMNKKLTHGLFAFLLAIALLIPIFPSSTLAGTSNAVKLAKLNEKIDQFDLAVSRAEQTLGHPRTMFLTAAALGMSLKTLDAEFDSQALPTNRFIIAVMIVRSSNVSLATVANMLRTGENVGEIVVQLSLFLKLSIFRLDSFIDALNSEIALSNGSSQQDLTSLKISFNNSMSALDAHMQLYRTRLGSELFNMLLFNRLGQETGMDPNEMDTLQRTFGTKTTAAQFTMMVLTANTINATMNGDFVLRKDLLIADELVTEMTRFQIPISIINGRLAYMQKDLSNN